MRVKPVLLLNRVCLYCVTSITNYGNGIMERLLYFAYSHHMDPMAMKRLGIHVHSYAHCVLLNYKLEFNVLQDEYFRFETSGVSNIMPCLGSCVEGMLYELDEPDTKLLDEESGVSTMKYYRKCVDVHCQNGKQRALCYTAWPDMTSKGLHPSDEHVKQIIKAAQRAGISPHYQNWLQSQLHTTSVAV